MDPKSNGRMPSKSGDKVFWDSNAVLGKNPDGTEVSLVSGSALMKMGNDQLDKIHMDAGERSDLKWAQYYEKHPESRPTDSNIHPIGDPPQEVDETTKTGDPNKISAEELKGLVPAKRANSRAPDLKAGSSIPAHYTALNEKETLQLETLLRDFKDGKINPHARNAQVEAAQHMLEGHGYKFRFGRDGKYGSETGANLHAALLNNPGTEAAATTFAAPKAMTSMTL